MSVEPSDIRISLSFHKTVELRNIINDFNHIDSKARLDDLDVNEYKTNRQVNKQNIIEFIEQQQVLQSQLIAAEYSWKEKVFHYISGFANLLMLINIVCQNILTDDVTIYQNFVFTGSAKLAGTVLGILYQYSFEGSETLLKLISPLSGLVKIIALTIVNKSVTSQLPKYIIQAVTFFQIATRCVFMFRLRKYQWIMVATFFTINVMTEVYNVDIAKVITIVMLVAESLYISLECVCLVLLLITKNPKGQVTKVEPKATLLLFNFAKITCIIVSLGILTNITVQQINDINEITLWAALEILFGILGMLTFWGLHKLQTNYGTDSSQQIIFYFEIGGQIFVAIMILYQSIWLHLKMAFACLLLQYSNIGFTIYKTINYVQSITKYQLILTFCLCMIYPICQFFARILWVQSDRQQEVLLTIMLFIESCCIFSHAQYSKVFSVYQEELFDLVKDKVDESKIGLAGMLDPNFNIENDKEQSEEVMFY